MCSCQLAFRASGVFPLPDISKDAHCFVYHQTWLLSRFLCISFGNFTVAFSHIRAPPQRTADLGDVNFRHPLVAPNVLISMFPPRFSILVLVCLINISEPHHYYISTGTQTDSACGKRWKKEENHIRKESCVLIESWDYTARLKLINPALSFWIRWYC